MNFLKKAFGFVSRPTHSRTMGLLVVLVLAVAVTFTVVSSQNQQTLRQRAAETSTSLLNSSLPNCGDGLTCSASSAEDSCSADKNKCLSARGFDGAEIDSGSGKSVVCCNAKQYRLIDNVCTLSTIGLHSDSTCDQSSSPPAEIPICKSGLTCEARATCLSGETKCASGDVIGFGNGLDQLNGNDIVCCNSPIATPDERYTFSGTVLGGPQTESVSVVLSGRDINNTPMEEFTRIVNSSNGPYAFTLFKSGLYNVSLANIPAGYEIDENDIEFAFLGGSQKSATKNIILAPVITPTPTTTEEPTLTPTPKPQNLGGPVDPSEGVVAPPAGNTCTLKSKGDADCDDDIDLFDFNIWMGQFKNDPSTSTPVWNADFNKSGSIDLVDFNIWRDGFK